MLKPCPPFHYLSGEFATNCTDADVALTYGYLFDYTISRLIHDVGTVKTVQRIFHHFTKHLFFNLFKGRWNLKMN